jgi:hypothetical protein
MGKWSKWLDLTSWIVLTVAICLLIITDIQNESRINRLEAQIQACQNYDARLTEVEQVQGWQAGMIGQMREAGRYK